MSNDRIIIRSVTKITKSKIGASRDPETGLYPEHIREVDANGYPILMDEDRKTKAGKLPIFPITRVVDVYDGRVFDMFNPQDKSDWEAIKHSRMIAPMRTAKDSNGKYLIDGTVNVFDDTARLGSAEFYIEIPGELSKEKITRKKLVHKAETYIYGASKETKDLWLKFMGQPLYGLPESDIDEYLVNIADKTPERIINLAEDSNTDLRLLLISAREKGVILKKDGLFKYGDDIVLGFSEDSVIEWMKDLKNAVAMKAIRKETFPNIKTKE